MRPAPGVVKALEGAGEEVGYCPSRGTFDVEWDDEAEMVLGDLTFVEGEAKEETDLKLKMIEIYNTKLDERQARKKFILGRGLLDTKRLQAFDRRRTKAEKELAQRMKPFARFHSQEQHEQLVNCLSEELRLRNQLAIYQGYRELGITTLLEAEKYEVLAHNILD